MIVKLKVRTAFVLSLLFVLWIQSCAPSQGTPTEDSFALSTSTPGEVPTWTLRPIEMTRTALPTGSMPASISIATSTPQPATETPNPLKTPKVVAVRIEGGNLFVHRGPSLDYNYIGVLHNGDLVVATGRDRVSRWVRVALPSKPDVQGWITTETQYTKIDGDVSNLPYIETGPARPAYIRNCTKHEMWVMPPEVKLLNKFKSPDNEERFPVGIYQIYDSENPKDIPIEEISLSEGKTVDIRYDWTGERSKCGE